MDNDIERMLDDCIAELRKGQSIEECLAKYPGYESQLRPLLELARTIEQLPKPEPTTEAFSAALVSVGQEIPLLNQAHSPKRKKNTRSVFGKLFQQPRLAWTLSIAFGLVLVFVGISTVSANSVPGDILYPFKLATERVSFLLAFNSEKKAELRLIFSEQRTKEIRHVLQKSGKLNEKLLDAMLNEAQLALEEAPNDTSAIFLAKLNAVNTYQKDVLESFRSRVDSANRGVVNRAIGVCDQRGRWIRGMRHEDWEEMSPSPAPPHGMHRGRNRGWGPGCDWMR